MYALLILPILVSGFIICSINPYYKYRLYRYGGQYLYLQVITLGIISFIASLLILFLLRTIMPQNISIFTIQFEFSPITLCVKELSKSQSVSLSKTLPFVWSFFISLFSIIFAYIWSKCMQFYYNFGTRSLELMEDILSDSPLDALLFEAFIDATPVLLSLESKKVYVGIVNNLGEANENESPNQEISIIPILSGYRDDSYQIVQFTNYYDSTFYKNIDNFSVIIPQNQIITASKFDFDIYQEINDNLILNSPEV